MDKTRNIICAWVNANAEDLNRGLLMKEFSTFGKVRKIYIDSEKSFAKIYFTDPEGVKGACAALNGHRNWQVKCHKDEFSSKPPADKTNYSTNNYNINSVGFSTPLQQNQLFDQDRFSLSSSSQVGEMDEDCVYAGEYVDVHGRPVEVLQAENGQLFVNLDDVRSAGFNIYPKESFENATIPKELEMRHFELYLLNQGKKYIFNFKQTFNENEMLNVFERVLAKLQNAGPVAQFGEGRLINNTQNKNFSITARNNNVPPSAGHWGGNFQNPPNSFSQPKRGTPQDNRQNRQNGYSSNDSRRFQNPPGNRNRRNDNVLWDRKPEETNSFAGANESTQIRKPRFDDSRGSAMDSKPLVNKVESQESCDGQNAAAAVPALEPVSNTNASKPVVESLKLEPQNDSTEPKPQISTPISKPQIDTPVSEPEINTPISKPQIDTPAAKPEIHTPVSTPQIDTPAAKPEIHTPVPKPQIDTPVSKPQMDIPVPKPQTERPISKPQNGTPAGNDRNLLNIERVLLSPGTNCKVKVSYIKPEKKALFYCQLDDNANLLEEILLKVNTEDNSLPEISKPERNMLCVALFEDCWYRAVVLHNRPARPGCAFVELIDYGNKEEIQAPIREMSSEMKKIPGQAIRCALHLTPGFDPNTVEVDQVFEVIVKKHFDDLTHLIEVTKCVETININAEPVTPPELSDEEVDKRSKPSTEEECFTQIPKKLAKVVPGETVMVKSYTEDKLILRNKETAAICKNVYAHLQGMPKKPISSPKVGQLVLCNKDGDEGLHRAVIKRISGNTADVVFIDCSEGETLALKSLRNVDKTLASYPRAVIEQDYPVLNQLTDKGVALLGDLIFQKKKILVTLIDDNKVDFKIPDGDKTILLSEKIKELAKPVTKKPEEVEQPAPSTSTEKVKPPSDSARPVNKPASGNDSDEYAVVTYDAMPFITPKLGIGEYMCFCCKGDSLTMVSLSDENVSYLEKLSITEPADKNPHTPELYEMCLAKFEDIWYRALVTDVLENDVFEVLFVDYGNAENINKAELRRFPKSLVDIPLLGLSAYLVGIPDSPKVHRRLKELIPDESTLEIDVKVDINDDLKYGIEIPSVYETLKKEGLI